MDEAAREWTDTELTGLHAEALSYLDGLAADARLMIAQQYRTIAEIVHDAPRETAFWVGSDDSQLPDWRPPGGMTVARWRREREEFAIRAAVAEIAVRLHLSENAVRAKAEVGAMLQERCPILWGRFLGGSVAEQNAVVAAQLAGSLPTDEPETWAAFDRAVTPAAVRLTAVRFRTRARAVRERVHSLSIEERHERAVLDRGVWLSAELDGMATVTASLPAVAAHAVVERLDAAARHLQGAEGETRTLDQLRADVLVDLAMTPATDAVPAVQAFVSITVPVLTLLGASEQPATLDGYGPIDLDTARRLAGGATSWTRVLTHPVTGTVLDVDRTTYRPPADLRRFVERRQPTCAFPGCGRSSRRCDLDHKTAWADGGVTSADNLHPLCRSHHRLRHETAWSVEPGPPGSTRWRSPAGRLSASDPPPF